MGGPRGKGRGEVHNSPPTGCVYKWALLVLMLLLDLTTTLCKVAFWTEGGRMGLQVQLLCLNTGTHCNLLGDCVGNQRVTRDAAVCSAQRLKAAQSYGTHSSEAWRASTVMVIHNYTSVVAHIVNLRPNNSLQANWHKSCSISCSVCLKNSTLNDPHGQP